MLSLCIVPSRLRDVPGRRTIDVHRVATRLQPSKRHKILWPRIFIIYSFIDQPTIDFLVVYHIVERHKLFFELSIVLSMYFIVISYLQ